MAEERTDRLPFARESVLPNSPSKAQLFSAVASAYENRGLSFTPSQASLATTDSRGEICDKSVRVDLEEESSPYIIKNLSTGQTIDLREECHPEFANRFTLVLDCLPYYCDIQAQWYSSHSAERSSLAVLLYQACQRNEWKRAQSLLVSGANPCARMKEGWTALHVAAQKGFEDLCETLIEYRADVSLQNFTGQTPIHLSSHFFILKILLRTPPPQSTINSRDNIGRTALHYTVQRGDEASTRLLLTHGADTSIADMDGNSVFDICEDGPMYDVLREGLESRLGSSCLCESPTKTASAPVLIDLFLPSEPVLAKSTTVSPSDFAIIGQLGKGEFGEVFLVQHMKTGIKYAMKSVRKTRDISEHIKRERSMLARLEHPFIVKMHWAFQTGTHLYLVVDYCPCGTLNELLQQYQYLSEDAARFYLSEILLAIDFLHTNNVIHRDLKPENLVFDSAGHINLTDFGMAKDEMPAWAMTRSFCGPLAYSPPEMVARQGHGQEADWYMLGCLAYEMMVGIPPFSAREQGKLFRKIELGKVKFPGYVSEEAKDLIQSLLHLSPARRLGRNGSSEIKSHPFFSDIDWSLLLSKSTPAPLTPILKTPHSLSGRCGYGRFVEDIEETHVDGWTFARKE